LGYWLTPTGLKPWKQKIAAILALQPPQTVKQLRSFIGAVTYYRDMFPKRSHILAPLTALVGGKGTLHWTPECQQAFNATKALLAKDAFLRYPDHNKRFDIYCDASDRQLGAVITQENYPVAYYSRKLNSAQRNYTVGEKEILSVVETLKEYRNMLYGCPNIHVHTDHKNNTFHRLQTQRVLRWRLFLEDYNVQFHYIKGENNSFADALSRLPFSERQNPCDSPNRSTVSVTPVMGNEETADSSHNPKVIHPIDQQFQLHLSWVTKKLRIPHTIQSLIQMHFTIAISLIASCTFRQRKASHSSWLIRRLRKRKSGTLDYRFCDNNSLTSSNSNC
jgi:RNase H-like domain found in reverse transcriptase